MKKSNFGDMMGKILVFGATGKVGMEVAKAAYSKGEQVVAAVRDIEKAKAMLPGDIDFRLFRFDNLNGLDDLFRDVDRVYTMKPSLEQKAEESIYRIIDHAGEKGVKKIVNLSALGVESGQSSALGKIDEYVEKSGIDYSILRPNWFMQNFVTILLDQINEKSGIFLPTGDAKTCFIDTRDIAAVAVEAFTNNNHRNTIFQLTGGEALSYYETAEILSEVAGRDIKYYNISDEEFRNALKKQGVPDGYIEMSSWLYSVVRAGHAAMMTDDVKNVTGREPITFRKFASDYAGYWK